MDRQTELTIDILKVIEENHKSINKMANDIENIEDKEMPKHADQSEMSHFLRERRDVLKDLESLYMKSNVELHDLLLQTCDTDFQQKYDEVMTKYELIAANYDETLKGLEQREKDIRSPKDREQTPLSETSLATDESLATAIVSQMVSQKQFLDLLGKDLTVAEKAEKNFKIRLDQTRDSSKEWFPKKDSQDIADNFEEWRACLKRCLKLNEEKQAYINTTIDFVKKTRHSTDLIQNVYRGYWKSINQKNSEIRVESDLLVTYSAKHKDLAKQYDVIQKKRNMEKQIQIQKQKQSQIQSQKQSKSQTLIEMRKQAESDRTLDTSEQLRHLEELIRQTMEEDSEERLADAPADDFKKPYPQSRKDDSAQTALFNEISKDVLDIKNEVNILESAKSANEELMRQWQIKRYKPAINSIDQYIRAITDLSNFLLLKNSKNYDIIEALRTRTLSDSQLSIGRQRYQNDKKTFLKEWEHRKKQNQKYLADIHKSFDDYKVRRSESETAIGQSKPVLTERPKTVEKERLTEKQKSQEKPKPPERQKPQEIPKPPERQESLKKPTFPEKAKSLGKQKPPKKSDVADIRIECINEMNAEIERNNVYLKAYVDYKKVFEEQRKQYSEMAGTEEITDNLRNVLDRMSANQKRYEDRNRQIHETVIKLEGNKIIGHYVPSTHQNYKNGLTRFEKDEKPFGDELSQLIQKHYDFEYDLNKELERRDEMSKAKVTESKKPTQTEKAKSPEQQKSIAKSKADELRNKCILEMNAEIDRNNAWLKDFLVNRKKFEEKQAFYNKMTITAEIIPIKANIHKVLLSLTENRKRYANRNQQILEMANKLKGNKINDIDVPNTYQNYKYGLTKFENEQKPRDDKLQEIIAKQDELEENIDKSKKRRDKISKDTESKKRPVSPPPTQAEKEQQYSGSTEFEGIIGDLAAHKSGEHQTTARHEEATASTEQTTAGTEAEPNLLQKAQNELTRLRVQCLFVQKSDSTLQLKDETLALMDELVNILSLFNEFNESHLFCLISYDLLQTMPVFCEMIHGQRVLMGFCIDRHIRIKNKYKQLDQSTINRYQELLQDKMPLEESAVSAEQKKQLAVLREEESEILNERYELAKYRYMHYITTIYNDVFHEQWMQRSLKLIAIADEVQRSGKCEKQAEMAGILGTIQATINGFDKLVSDQEIGPLFLERALTDKLQNQMYAEGGLNIYLERVSNRFRTNVRNRSDVICPEFNAIQTPQPWLERLDEYLSKEAEEM